MQKSSDPNLVIAAEHALLLIEAIGERRTLRVNDAAELLGVVPSTAHRLLSTLRTLGFVVQERRSGPYGVGPRLTELALAAYGGVDVRAIARPILAGLRDELAETVNLMVLRGNEVHFIESLEGPGAVRVGSRVGLVLPAHCSSGGKVILANLDSEELHRRYPDRVLKVRTPRTIDNWDRLLEELSTVRQDGFALNLEEGDDGIAAVGYPIRRDSNSPLAAIAVAAPAFRVNREDALRRIVPAMARAAGEIERQMRTGDIRHDSTRVVTDTDDHPRN